MRILIEYSGHINGRHSYDFMPFEHALPESIAAAAAEALEHANDESGDFVQKIRATAFDVSEGTVRDVTQDVLTATVEDYDFLKDRGPAVFDQAKDVCPASIAEDFIRDAREQVAHIEFERRRLQYATR